MIGIIGAGRVGVSFGKMLAQRNLLSGYYSESYPGEDLPIFETARALCEMSDIVFVTVPDDKITDVFYEIRDFCSGKILCHMSGAKTSGEAFPGFEKAASLHPMMAVADTNAHEQMKSAQFTAEGKAAEEIAKVLDFLSIRQIEPDKKPLYHTACVFASNLIQGVLKMSTEQLVRCGFDRHEALGALERLVKTNVANIFDMGTEKSLTGPVERADTQTVHRHMECLEGDEREVYRLLSKKLTYIAEGKNKKDYEDIRKELNK